MTEAPETIWAFDNGQWIEPFPPLIDGSPATPYTRTDIHEAVVAERDRLRYVLKTIGELGVITASDLAVIALKETK